MLSFQDNGNLIEGIHELSIEEVIEYYGYNDHRKQLIQGLVLLIKHLKDCNCKAIYLDGSFITKKKLPNDFDACWDVEGVNEPKMRQYYPTILDLSNYRKNQKDLYKGEFFYIHASSADPEDYYMLTFFQKCRDGSSKGIIKINL